jgi:diacylglycerol kinase
MLSGAEEYVDWVQDQFEETRVLARDGSSAQLLSIALSAIAMH